MKMKYYRVGIYSSEQQTPNDSVFPIEIYIASQPVPKLFYIFQGSGHGMMGSALMKNDLDNGFFKDSFIKCNCMWALNLKEDYFNDIANIIVKTTGSLVEKEIRI
ncbi:MAG: hypothetical protein IPK77_13055 [Cellvibrio sp.]|nr:hypothetical protein [Cellvibrio sp.]